MKIRLSSASLLTQIANAMFVLALANPGWAQSLPNYTNFPMIGLVRGQTVEIHISTFPTDPCFATIGFQNGHVDIKNQTLTLESPCTSGWLVLESTRRQCIGSQGTRTSSRHDRTIRWQSIPVCIPGSRHRRVYLARTPTRRPDFR